MTPNKDKRLLAILQIDVKPAFSIELHVAYVAMEIFRWHRFNFTLPQN